MIRELAKNAFFKLIIALILASLINMTPATLLHGEYSPAAARVFSSDTNPSTAQTASQA